MATVTCPLCSAEVRLHQFLHTANKPFCAKCGWNLDRAQSELAEKAKAMRLFVIAFVFGIVLVTAIAIYKKELAFFPLVLILGVVGFAYAWNYWGTKRALENASLGAITGSSSVRAPIPSLFLRRVQALPRPRKVVLQFTGYVAALLFAFVLIVVGVLLAIAGTESIGSLEFKELWSVLPLLVIAGIVGGTLIFQFVKERKKLSLFRDGEVAVARVVDQSVVQRGKQSFSEITYEFSLADGRLIRKTERDHTKLIFEDMLIPVFYESSSPDDCVALCATYFRLSDAEN